MLEINPTKNKILQFLGLSVHCNTFSLLTEVQYVLLFVVCAGALFLTAHRCPEFKQIHVG